MILIQRDARAVLEALDNAQDQIKYLHGKLSAKRQRFTEPSTSMALREIEAAKAIMINVKAKE